MEPMKIKQVGRLIQDQHGNPRGIEDWWIESRIDYPLDAARYCQDLWMRLFQAASCWSGEAVPGSTSSPFLKVAPART